MIGTPRTAYLAAMLAFALTLPSCTENLSVTVNTNAKVTKFHFGTSNIFSGRLEPICLRMIEVWSAETKEKIWRIVKKGDRCAPINSAILGNPPSDFRVEIDRLPPKLKKRYRVSIIADEGAVTSEVWTIN